MKEVTSNSPPALGTRQDAEPQLNREQFTPPDSEAKAEPRRRYIKVDVAETTFIHVHDMANASRMRLLPYLRLYLKNAHTFQASGKHGDLAPFATPKNHVDSNTPTPLKQPENNDA